MNKVMLTGRLVRDPEMRISTKGKEITNFTIAVDRRFTRDGENSADFIKCVAFGKVAGFIAEYFRKGSGIEVEGEVRTGSYEKDGQRINTFEINVDRVEFPKGGGYGKSETSDIPAANGLGFDIDFDDDELPFE